MSARKAKPETKAAPVPVTPARAHASPPHAENLIRAFRKATFNDLQGEEVLALASALRWLVETHVGPGRVAN